MYIPKNIPKSKNLEFYSQKIIKLNQEMFLSYEDTLSFNRGYITCLYKEGIITKNEQDNLLLVHANKENGNHKYSISGDKVLNIELNFDTPSRKYPTPPPPSKPAPKNVYINDFTQEVTEKP